MTFNEFLSEIKSDLRQYNESNLIDDLSVYNWVNEALKKFGANIMVMQNTIIEIKNGKGKLPENFYQMKYAAKCQLHSIQCEKEDKDDVVASYFYREISLRDKEFLLCNKGCDRDIVDEKIYSDKIYINSKPVRRNYHRPMSLRLAKSFKSNVCSNECTMSMRTPSEYEVMILGNTISTNMKEGSIYLEYVGVEIDDEGFTVIPDTSMGALETYLKYYVKRNIVEIIMVNGDDPSAANLLQYFTQMQQSHFGLAMTAIKFEGVSPSSLYKIRSKNKREASVFKNKLH